MKRVTLEVPEDALRLMGKTPEEFAREVYETAVVHWFDKGRISQGKAAELLGISRGELFDVLFKHEVSPLQVTPEELETQFKRG